MNGISIQSVTPQKWSPGFSPKHVSLQGSWKPAPLPKGPGGVSGQIAQTLGIAMSPDIALGQAGTKALAAGTIALLTLPALATAYVGFRLGTKDEGFPAILGYLVGSLASLGVLAGLLAMIGVAVPMWPVPVPSASQAPALPPLV